MSRIRNERLKLLATGLNGAGVGCFTAGVVTPIVALVLDLPGTQGRSGIVILVSLIWLLVRVNLHSVGQLILGRLKDDRA